METDSAGRWVVPRVTGRNYVFAFKGEKRVYVYYLVVHLANNTMEEKRGRSAGYWLEWPTGVTIKDKEGKAQRFDTAEEAADALKDNWAEYAAGYVPRLHGRLEQPRPSWANTVVANPANKGWMWWAGRGMGDNKAVPVDPSTRSRLDLVLALGKKHLEATGCSPQAHLGGERAPCGAIVVTDAGGGTFATAIVTSKPRSSLHLDPATHIGPLAPEDASPAAQAAYNGMNQHLSGPYYGNIYSCAVTSGLVNAPSTTGNPSGCCRGNATPSAESVALGQIAAMGVKPLVGDKLGTGVAKAFAPVREAVYATAGEGVQVYAVPFVSSY